MGVDIWAGDDLADTEERLLKAIEGDAVDRGKGGLSVGAKTLAREGDDTVCERRGAGGGVCGLGRLGEESAGVMFGVASTNFRFLDADAVEDACESECEFCGGNPTDGVLHLDQGGGGGTCWLGRLGGRSAIKPLTGVDE